MFARSFHFRLTLAALAPLSFLLTACETTQGAAPGAAQPATQTGGREIQPAPESKSYTNKANVFQGAEYDPGVAPLPQGAQQITMRVGDVREVFRGSFAPGDGQREMAFYLPPEARSVVQLVVETRGFSRSYFLRAIGVGDTVGGPVERRWLDDAGYDVRDGAAEARVQASVRAAPFLISVR